MTKIEKICFCSLWPPLLKNLGFPLLDLSGFFFNLRGNWIFAQSVDNFSITVKQVTSAFLKKTVFWTRYTFEFTVRKWSITVRPWNQSQNRESHGKTVRLGRSANVCRSIFMVAVIGLIFPVRSKIFATFETHCRLECSSERLSFGCLGFSLFSFWQNLFRWYQEKSYIPL